jgi:hypothetical protein
VGSRESREILGGKDEGIAVIAERATFRAWSPGRL